MKDEALIELGDQVADIVSAVEGIVTGVCYYLNGCIQVEVSPRAGSMSGFTERPQPFWVDEQQVTLGQKDPYGLAPVASIASRAGMPRGTDEHEAGPDHPPAEMGLRPGGPARNPPTGQRHP